MAAADPNSGLLIGKLGVEGDSYGGLDSTRLKQILPQETGLAVAKELQKRSSDGVENLANSLGFFGNLPQPDKTTFMFEKVFPLVAASVWKKEGLEGLPVSDVLKCRGVCKQWNAAVDKLIPEKLQFLGHGSENYDYKLFCIGEKFKGMCEDIKFSTNDEEEENRSRTKQSVRNFLRHFELTHQNYQSGRRNPWIWGKIIVDIGIGVDVHVNQRFVENISSMLSKYGGHLSSFKGWITKYKFFENASLLQKWLSHMPNLIEFHFVNRSTLFYRRRDPDRQMNIEGSPFPKLKKLEKMHIADLPLAMFNELISQNNHVSELSLFDGDEHGYNPFQVSLPNLKEIEFKDYCGNNIVEKWRSPSTPVQCPIETLNFRFYKSVRLNSLFEVIQNKCSNTLVRLTLNLANSPENYVGHWLACKNFRLDLPKLREISLVMCGTPALCLDFLLPMRNNLEEISFMFGYEFPFRQNVVETSGTIVQFIGFEGKMMESNLWEIFTKLKKIQVIHSRGWNPILKSYSREGEE